MAETTKPCLNLVGPDDGEPSLDDLVALFERLTGRKPTTDELAEARAALDAEPDVDVP